MEKLNVAPTKSNLLAIKEQQKKKKNGYQLLEQKREILVMDLMRIVEKVKLLERELDKQYQEAYPVLKNMLKTVGGDRVERIAHAVKYDFHMKEKKITAGGMNFDSIDVELPRQQLFYSFLGSYADSDKVMVDFFKLLKLLTEMASIRTVAWRLANEIKKTQRRVNSLNKMVIPQTLETKTYIESVLEERERENTFVLKVLKNRKQ